MLFIGYHHYASLRYDSFHCIGAMVVRDSSGLRIGCREEPGLIGEEGSGSECIGVAFAFELVVLVPIK